jgi:hypothetical protein
MGSRHPDSFGARDTLEVSGRTHEIFRLHDLQEQFNIARLPFSLKVLLENLLRTLGACGGARADRECGGPAAAHRRWWCRSARSGSAVRDARLGRLAAVKRTRIRVPASCVAAASKVRPTAANSTSRAGTGATCRRSERRRKWRPFVRRRERATRRRMSMVRKGVAGEGPAVVIPREGSFLGALFEPLVTQSCRRATRGRRKASVGHLRAFAGEHEVDSSSNEATDGWSPSRSSSTRWRPTRRSPASLAA